MRRLFVLAALVAAFLILAPVMSAFAHDPYTGLRDPRTGGLCCGGEDCAILNVRPGTLSFAEDGIRLRLTEEEARLINPKRIGPVDTVIPVDRIQETPKEWGANFRVCIPTENLPRVRERDFFCFWAPGNS